MHIVGVPRFQWVLLCILFPLTPPVLTLVDTKRCSVMLDSVTPQITSIGKFGSVVHHIQCFKTQSLPQVQLGPNLVDSLLSFDWRRVKKTYFTYYLARRVFFSIPMKTNMRRYISIYQWFLFRNIFSNLENCFGWPFFDWIVPFSDNLTGASYFGW